MRKSGEIASQKLGAFRDLRERALGREVCGDALPAQQLIETAKVGDGPAGDAYPVKSAEPGDEH